MGLSLLALQAGLLGGAGATTSGQTQETSGGGWAKTFQAPATAAHFSCSYRSRGRGMPNPKAAAVEVHKGGRTVWSNCDEHRTPRRKRCAQMGPSSEMTSVPLVHQPKSTVKVCSYGHMARLGELTGRTRSTLSPQRGCAPRAARSEGGLALLLQSGMRESQKDPTSSAAPHCVAVRSAGEKPAARSGCGAASPRSFSTKAASKPETSWSASRTTVYALA